MVNFTVDDFLGGQIHLKQSEEGYRATSDAVLLASAVRAKSGECILDVGTGTGIIPCCVNARTPGCDFFGVECQSDLIDLAQENAIINKCRLSVIKADISCRPSPLHGKLFHHVVTNPPFYTEPFSRTHQQTDIAYRERVSLEEWLAFCLRHLRAKGTLTLIHRTEALPVILSVLYSRLGAIEIFPIMSKPNDNAKRLIVRGVMNSRKALVLRPPLVMHNGDGSRSEVAESLLRTGLGLDELLK